MMTATWNASEEYKFAKVPSYWYGPAALVMLTIVCLALRQGKLLNYLFPTVSLALAWYLAKRSPVGFVRLFVLLLMFSPLVRRLSDYSGAFTDPSPVLLAPLLAPVAALPAIRFRKIVTREFLPFALAMLAILFALLVGILSAHDPSAGVAFLRWSSPVYLGCYLATQGRMKERLCATFLNTVMWSSLVCAAYGLLQLVLTPAWDMLWLKAMLEGGQGNSYGRPFPFAFRLFGTLNSTGVAAAMMGFGVLGWLASSSRWRYAALLILLPALFLTLVRTEYLCVPAAIAALLVMDKGGRRRLMVTGMIVLCAVVSTASIVGGAIPQAGNAVNDRLNTFGEGGRDESYLARTMAMKEGLLVALESPFGKGLGYVDSKEYASSHMANPSNASGEDLAIVGLLLDLGFPGLLLCISAAGIACVKLLAERNSSNSVFYAPFALLFFLHLWSANPFVSTAAFLFWGATGLASCSQVPHEISPETGSFGFEGAEAQCKGAVVETFRRIHSEVLTADA